MNLADKEPQNPLQPVQGATSLTMVSIPTSVTLGSGYRNDNADSKPHESTLKQFKHTFNVELTQEVSKTLIAVEPGDDNPRNEAWAQDPLLEPSEVKTIILAFPDNPAAREEAGVLTHSIPVQEAINRVQEKLQGTTDLPNVGTVNPIHSRISPEEREILHGLFEQLSNKLRGVQNTGALEAEYSQPGFTFDLSDLSPRYHQQLNRYLQLNQSSAISTPATPPKPNLIHIRNFLTLQMISPANRDTVPDNLYYQLLANATNRTIHFNEQIFIPSQWGRYLNQIQAIRHISTQLSEQNAVGASDSVFDPEAFLLDLSNIVRRDNGNEQLMMDILKTADEYDIFSEQEDNLADALGDYFMQALVPQIPQWIWGPISQKLLGNRFEKSTPEMAVMHFVINTMHQREFEIPSSQAFLFRDLMHPEVFNNAAQKVYRYFNVDDMNGLRRVVRLELLYEMSLRPFSDETSANGNGGEIPPGENGLGNTNPDDLPEGGPQASFETQWPDLNSGNAALSSFSPQLPHSLRPLSSGPGNADSTENSFQPPKPPGGKTAVAASPEEEPNDNTDITIPDYVPSELRILESQIAIPEYVPNWMLPPASSSTLAAEGATENADPPSASTENTVSASKQTHSDPLSNKDGAEQRTLNMERLLGKGWRQGLRPDLNGKTNPENFYPGGFGEGNPKPTWEDYIPGAKDPDFKPDLTQTETFPDQDKSTEELLNPKGPGKPQFQFPPIPEEAIGQHLKPTPKIPSDARAYQLALNQVPELKDISYTQFSRLSAGDQAQFINRAIEFRKLPAETNVSLYEYVDSKQTSDTQRQQFQSEALKNQVGQKTMDRSEAQIALSQAQIQSINAQINALQIRVNAAQHDSAPLQKPVSTQHNTPQISPASMAAPLSSNPAPQPTLSPPTDQQATPLPRFMVIQSQNGGRLLVENKVDGNTQALPFMLPASTPLTRQEGASWYNVPDAGAIAGRTLLDVLFLQTGIKMLNNGGAVQLPNNVPPPLNAPQLAH